jgi:ABC-type Fe3+-hydroxamate transport system substrate-binding protein
MLAALAVLALGCQESGFDESKETSKPLKVQHARGETKVPGQAEQAMTLTVDTLDDTLALDVRPVRAAVPGAKLPDYLRSAGRGVSLMRPVTQSDLPAVEADHPDLILGTATKQTTQLYDDLSRIAPTVMLDGRGSQWKLDLRLAGEGLGRTNDAEQLLTDYDHEVAQTRDAIAGKPTVAIARMTPDGLRYAPRDSFAGTILSDMGLKQVRGKGADLTLRSEVWWTAGGPLAARAALADLRDALGG